MSARRTQSLHDKIKSCNLNPGVLQMVPEINFVSKGLIIFFCSICNLKVLKQKTWKQMCYYEEKIELLDK